MADTLKNRVRFSTTLSPETDRVLKEFSQNSMIPTSKLVDRAIMDFICSYSKKSEGKE